MLLRDFLRERLNRGPVSVPMAACDACNAGLVSRLPDDYSIVRAELEAMANAGEAQKWPEHDCWSLPNGAHADKPKGKT